MDARLKAMGGVDLLLFNPPYVPTIASEADDAQDARGIAGAWAGGHDGMDITQRVLDSLKVRHFLLCLAHPITTPTHTGYPLQNWKVLPRCRKGQRRAFNQESGPK